MNNFQRRLPEVSIEALERLVSNRAGWWPDLLAEWAPSGSMGKLRLAVRNGYMNFYSKGQSIAKVSFGHGGKTPAMQIHEKYVSSAKGKGYVKFELSDETGRDPDGQPVEGGSEKLRTWISKSDKDSKTEKRCIDALVGVSPKVIDLEMALPAFNDPKTAPRVDIVALEGVPEDTRLVFWEAKMIRNQSLRSKHYTPKVFKQIDRYRCYLKDPNRRQQVAEAYRQCCSIICKLHSMAAGVGMTLPLDPLIVAAGNPGSRLEVEDTPRLVIFDDGKKRDEGVWGKHLEVLCRKVPVAIVEQRPMQDSLEALPRRRS